MPSRRKLRVWIGLVWVVLAVTYVVRSAFVAAYADLDLARAERVWPGHPSVLASRALLEAAQASAQTRPLQRSTQALLADVARIAPLAPQPFLIAGAEAQRNREDAAAERLLLSARQRDPRAAAAHYLLAQQYISQGRFDRGMPEAAVLARLLPGSVEPLASAFANYLTTVAVPDGMSEVLKSNPALAERIFSDLSANPRNADLLLKIAPRELINPAPPWQSNLINKLVEAGDYQRARQVWARLAGHRTDQSETIHDPHFEGSSAPEPFNWTFATQGAVVEPQSGGLHILYFGRDDTAIAHQLLVLRPGRYRLQMDVSGQVADPQAVRWTIVCLPGRAELLDAPVAPGKIELDLTVPSSGCAAQQLALSAQGAGHGGSSDFLISNLRLARAGAR